MAIETNSLQKMINSKMSCLFGPQGKMDQNYTKLYLDPL